MNTSKLKSLNQSITSILQPRFGNPVMLNCQNDLSMQMNSYTACPLCEETRRQNYKLKQQLLIVEDQDETINNLKAELEATK